VFMDQYGGASTHTKLFVVMVAGGDCHNRH
jgi:hypothetical protein